MHNRVPTATLDLTQVPRVALAARGTHGMLERAYTEAYLLPHHWCLHAYSYAAAVEVGGNRIPIRPGTLTLFPPNTELKYHYLTRSSHYFVHFTMPESTCRRAGVEVPLVLEAGSEYADFQEGLRLVGTTDSPPERQAARLWELLWRYHEKGTASHSQDHECLVRALALLHSRMDEPVSIARLAHECGISHNHLTRLFRSRFETTVVGYLRRQRVERALYLLRETSLPLRVVAAQVGIPDTRQFSAVIKQETGKTPRDWRRTAHPREKRIIA